MTYLLSVCNLECYLLSHLKSIFLKRLLYVRSQRKLLGNIASIDDVLSELSCYTVHVQ